MNKRPFSLSSVPSLSPELNHLYQGLSIEHQNLFVKVFKYLWGVVLPVQSFRGRSGVLRSFWALSIILRSYRLPPQLLDLITFIYYITQNNAKYICSDQVFNNNMVLPGVCVGAKKNYLTTLSKRGYLARSWSNPDQPYLQKSYRSRPVFIKLSPAGVQLIHDIEKDLYKLLLNTSLNDLTGANKKPG